MVFSCQFSVLLTKWGQGLHCCSLLVPTWHHGTGNIFAVSAWTPFFITFSDGLVFNMSDNILFQPAECLWKLSAFKLIFHKVINVLGLLRCKACFLLIMFLSVALAFLQRSGRRNTSGINSVAQRKEPDLCIRLHRWCLKKYIYAHRNLFMITVQIWDTMGNETRPSFNIQTEMATGFHLHYSRKDR